MPDSALKALVNGTIEEEISLRKNTHLYLGKISVL